MKKIVLLVAVLFSVGACKKSVQPEKSGNQSIVGKWKLSDYYGSPGGSVDLNAIPWMPVDPSNEQYIEFTADSTFINSLDSSIVPDHYSVNDSTIIIVRQSQKIYLGYKIANPFLSLYGNLSFGAICIEFCETRYISVQ